MAMNARQQQIVDMVHQGMSLREIADALGEGYSAVKSRWRRAKQWIDAPEGMRAAVDVTGLDFKSARHGWRIIQHDDGSRDSVFWRNAESHDLIEAIKAAMEGLPAIAPVAAPPMADADLLTLYPIADAHIGMLAWRRETGEAYDADIASRRVIDWIGRAVDASPASGTAIVLDVGDLTHADDDANMTPRSKHNLQVDGRHYRTVDTAIAAMCGAIELAAAKHERVIVRILPGNHNPHAYLPVLFAIRERYRDDPRIQVQAKPGEFFVHQFGRVMIAAHHGDKAKADRLAHFLAAEFAPIWGATEHRYLFTGHLHHHKSADIGGVVWEQLRAITARDAYAYSHAYYARAQIDAITYHRDRGQIFRASVGQ